jgi:hypothetical protein
MKRGQSWSTLTAPLYSASRMVTSSLATCFLRGDRHSHAECNRQHISLKYTSVYFVLEALHWTSCIAGDQLGLSTSTPCSKRLCQDSCYRSFTCDMLARCTVKPAMHYSCYGRRSSMESTRVTLKFKQFGSTRLIFLHCHDAHVHVYKCTVAANDQIGRARMASSHAAHETTERILHIQWLSLWLSGLPFLGSRTSKALFKLRLPTVFPVSGSWKNCP